MERGSVGHKTRKKEMRNFLRKVSKAKRKEVNSGSSFTGKGNRKMCRITSLVDIVCSLRVTDPRVDKLYPETYECHS